MRLALSMPEINENVFNIEIIRYLRKPYPAFKLYFIVSNHVVMYKTIFVINIIIHMCLQHSNTL